jgi:hypothetical protein
MWMNANIIIEIIVGIIIVVVAGIATWIAVRQNNKDAFLKRGLHQRRKLLDLKTEIEELYRMDLPGVIRTDFGPSQSDGYQIRYHFLLKEMEQNGTLFVSKYNEVIPEVKLVLLALIRKSRIQYQITKYLAQDSFPIWDDDIWPDIDYGKATDSEFHFKRILTAFENYEKEFHEVRMVKKFDSEDEEAKFIDSLPKTSYNTFFHNSGNLYVIDSDDWGDHVQSILLELEARLGLNCAQLPKAN